LIRISYLVHQLHMRACLREQKSYSLKVFVVSNAFGVPRCWVLLDILSEQWILLANIYFTRLLNYLTGSRSYGSSTSQLSFLVKRVPCVFVLCML